MARYIDADSLIKTLYIQSDDDGFICCGAEDLETLINAQPTADVRKNVKGEWKPHPTEREWDFCSNCGVGVHRREYGLNPDGTEWATEMSYDYCPWCGADMRGKKNGEHD